jgi:hypothetical protein
MSRLLAPVVAATLIIAGLAPAPRASAVTGDPTTVRYVPPVRPPAGVITDHFRAPPTPYSAGNRGLDYATVPGTVVVAAAAGVVAFAGAVGGTLHVTIAHPDGLRTSYSFLARVLVRSGEQVRQSQPVGVAGAVFHFGVRDPRGDYLDPERLFAGHRGAHLVPGPDEDAAPLVDDRDERRSLLGVVHDLVRRGGGATLAVADEELSLLPPVSAARLAAELGDLAGSQRGCTPAAVQVPRLRLRRIAVLVGGLGSTSATAAVDRVDTDHLGYRRGDVLRFSYAGGRVPSPGEGGRVWSSVPERAYAADETTADLQVVAARLVDLLEQVASSRPGVPIDLIAHSEGGVVARLALDQAAAAHRLPTAVGLLVAIAAPFQGADAATALEAVSGAPGAAALIERAAGSHVAGDLQGSALVELSQVSATTAELARPAPPGVQVVSIGASGDLTVPWVRTRTDGATPVLVTLSGVTAHDRLPGSPATTRAIALARAGRPPACVARTAQVRGVVTSHLLAGTEDAVGLTLGLALPP